MSRRRELGGSPEIDSKIEHGGDGSRRWDRTTIRVIDYAPERVWAIQGLQREIYICKKPASDTDLRSLAEVDYAKLKGILDKKLSRKELPETVNPSRSIPITVPAILPTTDKARKHKPPGHGQNIAETPASNPFVRL